MKRIGFKLWTGIMLLIGVVLVLLWLFQIVFLERFYKEARVSELIRKGNNLVKWTEDKDGLTDRINEPGFKESVDQLVYQTQLSLEVIDDKGNVLYATDNGNSMMPMGMMRNYSQEVYQRALSGEVVKLEAAHPRFGGSFLIIGLPIHGQEEINGAILMNVPIAPVEETADILKQQLLWITLILSLISVLIAIFLSRMFSRPILKLHQLAESFSVGDFGARVTIQGKDELGLLAERMNSMGEELGKNEQLRKELIANVSHELRTPLSLIRGYAETLRDVTGGNPEKRASQLNVIIEETERLNKIVEDILTLSQYQAGAISLNIKAFLLKDMMESVSGRYDAIQLNRDITVQQTSLEQPVIGDRERLEQVLYNLINNAINHTGEGGRILITASPSNDRVRIEVEDNGHGIDEKELPHIFERYYRGKKTVRNKKSGTGLGLAIVKSILELHQIPYGIRSKVGAGTSFWFDLPVSNSHTSF